MNNTNDYIKMLLEQAKKCQTPKGGFMKINVQTIIDKEITGHKKRLAMAKEDLRYSLKQIKSWTTEILEKKDKHVNRTIKTIADHLHDTISITEQIENIENIIKLKKGLF